MTASRNRLRLRRLEKQNSLLPTVVGDDTPSGLSAFVDATKNAILDHLSDSNAQEMEPSEPTVLMDEGVRAPWFWGCDEQPRCLMLNITGAHPDMIKCVLTVSHNSSLITNLF